MIHNIFPTKVLIKELDFSDEFTTDLTATIEAIYKQYEGETGKRMIDISNNSMPVFTEENLKNFPELQTIQHIFIDGFYELASSYSTNKFTKNQIQKMVTNYSGRLPFLGKGEYRRVHTHVGASAYGILYLKDVDNQRKGGELILHDPSFHNNFGFTEQNQFPISTLKNRLVIAPAYIWHEVTPYTGEENRVSIVLNLDIFSESDLLESIS